MNKVVLMGRLTKDPEVRYTQTNNVLVASFSLAVNRRYVKQGEERQADFLNIVAWNKTGEFCSKYFKKGQQVGIIGRLQSRTWDDDKGRHYMTEVVAEEAYFAEGRRDTEATRATFDNAFGATLPGGMNIPSEMTTQDATSEGNEGASTADFEVSASDDLPF